MSQRNVEKKRLAFCYLGTVASMATAQSRHSDRLRSTYVPKRFLM